MKTLFTALILMSSTLTSFAQSTEETLSVGQFVVYVEQNTIRPVKFLAKIAAIQTLDDGTKELTIVEYNSPTGKANAFSHIQSSSVSRLVGIYQKSSGPVDSFRIGRGSRSSQKLPVSLLFRNGTVMAFLDNNQRDQIISDSDLELLATSRFEARIK